MRSDSAGAGSIEPLEIIIGFLGSMLPLEIPNGLRSASGTAAEFVDYAYYC